MNQYITNGYVRSREHETLRTVAQRRPADEWTPRPRGPAWLDRVGRTIATIGVGLIRDPETLHDVELQAATRAA